MFKDNNRFKKTAISFFVLFFIVFSFIVNVSVSRALAPYPQPTIEVISFPTEKRTILEKIWDQAAILYNKGGEALLNNVLRTSLNRLAYDAADKVVSGAAGQKPLFVKKKMGAYLLDIGDAAAGDFLDQLNHLEGMNLCSPDLNIVADIGLGLKDEKRPPEPSCKASTMVKSWGDEVQKFQDMTSKDFIKTFTSYFKPESNDLTVTFSLFQGMQSTENLAKENEEKEVSMLGGFIDKITVGGQKTSTPAQSKREYEEAQSAMFANMTNCDGDPWECAAQVFLNRLAIKGFQTAMELSFAPDKQDPLKDYDPRTVLTNQDSDSSTMYQSDQPGLRQILEPRFNERADYDILAELISCPTTTMFGQESAPSPNNCVIDEKFSSAISEQKTVGEAMNEGYLHKNWRFTGLNEEVPYNEAYNYRSILILKKYRIIPTSWEEAIYRSNKQNQPATLEDLVSCFDPDDEYDNFSQDFRPDQAWCQDLIDPNWVLKAPANYCAKEGFGHIINKQVNEAQNIEGSDTNIPSEIFVTRADDYCADEQSCILENSDGTCEAYGYCTGEKRTWNFNQDSCEPVFNSCETFKKQEDGQKISYLKNTLDYEGCDSDSVGCSFYSYKGPYNVSEDKVDWKAFNDIYLNNNMQDCSSEDEGCDSLIRVSAGYGHNFIKNGDFEEEDPNLDLWPSCPDDSCLIEDSYLGENAMQLSGVDDTFSIEVGPATHSISGKTYTFSFYAKDCSEGDDFGFVDGKYGLLDSSSSWQYYKISNTYSDEEYLGNSVDLVLNSSTCKVDNIKLELGDKGTNFSNYGDNNIVYQKMLPEYLWDTCYINSSFNNPDYRFKEDAPDVCSDNFTRLCNADEAGCQIFVSEDDNQDEVIAQTSVFDYCHGECVGYDTYVGAESYFNSSSGEKFIPETADNCSANDNGCQEFTNLDVLEQGGEAREYYKSLKQCIKPSENDCSTFYIWEGDSGGGYQLESYNLKKAEDSNEPAVVEDDSEECNESIYNLPIQHPDYNSDCYEFYNTEGEISYHSYSKTVTCSEDCHPYRMSNRNIDSNIDNGIDCNVLGDASYWDGDNDTCYYCKNGGTWSNEHSACIYNAIPNQGETCSQNASGCREYNGNSGNNIRIVKAYDFADSLQGWTGRCGDDAELSTEALGRNDHSLWYGDGEGGEACDGSGGGGVSMLVNTAQAYNDTERIEVELGSYNLNRGSAYNLKFMAKVNTVTDLDIYFENDNDLKSYFEIKDLESDSSVTLIGDNEWHQYELSLSSLNHRVSMDEALVIESDNSFYLDNVILREIVDRYYLIEDSWNTPDKCYYNILDEFRGENYNLGCSNYISNNQTVSLRSFSKLCQESAAGCQLMADTFNTKDYKESVYNDDNENGVCDPDEEDCLSISADEYVFAVYDPDKACTADSKGCQRLGKSTIYGQDTLFSDVYVENDPDKYSTILCTEDKANCKSWISDTGENMYFKDPGNKVCEWREGEDGDWWWYQKNVNKCDTNNNGLASDESDLCLSSDDCSIPFLLLEPTNTCILEDNECSITEDYCDEENTCDEITIDDEKQCSNNEDCRVNYCDGSLCTLTNNTCSSNDSCPNTNTCEDGRCVNSCIEQTEDLACPVDPRKTFGYGGDRNKVVQPTDGWAGLCNQTSSTCTEYIDPVSTHIVNNIFNSKFEDGGEKWNVSNSNATQNVNLVANRAYIFAANNLRSNMITPSIECPNETLRYINSGEAEGSNNDLNEDFVDEIFLTSEAPNRYRIIVSSLSQNCTINRDYAQEGDFDLILKEAIIDYQLSKNLNDETCDGEVSLEKGCILFNERAQNGSSGLQELIYNAYDSYLSESKSPQTGYDTYYNANAIYKVSPDRVCSTWLGCETKTVDENGNTICYNVADCDVIDKDGECVNFLSKDSGIHNYDTIKDKNSSGYSVLNNYFISNMYETGISPHAGSINFEGEDSWGEHTVLVDEPSPLDNNNDKQFNADYPAEGKVFLKSKATEDVILNKTIPVFRNQDYYINYLLNTRNLTYGKEATISILEVDSNDNSNVLASWDDRTNQWERKVYKFVPNSDKIKIQISSNEVDGSKYIYIDDINIEPVLKINDLGGPEDKYIPKSCRLYPEQDSLSCTSTHENVIASGWQGYCLQKDPYHPDICLMWYPVDTISTFNHKDSGYQGKTPLYYCSQADGNFVMMEKRKVDLELPDDSLVCREGYTGPENKCKPFISEYWDHQSEPYKVLEIFIPDAREEDDPGGLDCALWGDDFSDGKIFYVIVPKNSENIKITTTCRSGSAEYYTGDIKGPPDSYGFAPTEEIFNNFLNNCAKNQPRGCDGGFDIKVEYNLGWYQYNDNIELREKDRSDGDIDPMFKVYDYLDDTMYNLEEYGVRCNQFEQVVQNDGSNKAWAVRSKTNTNDTPSFFKPFYERLNGYTYDREDRPFGSAILSSDAFSDSSDDIYFKNNRFDEYVNDQKDSYAGIPYGCNDSKNDGNCEQLGYCKNNPQYTCIVVEGNGIGDKEANKEQCGDNDRCIPYFRNIGDQGQYSCDGSGDPCFPQCDGLGSCVEDPNGLQHSYVCSGDNTEQCMLQCEYGAGGVCMETNETGFIIPKDGKEILMNIFLQSYATMKFNGNKDWEREADSYDYSFTGDDDIGICNGSRGEDQDCAISPQITNIGLFKGGIPMSFNGSKFIIDQNGSYDLKFNTIIDSEQLPLAVIKIDWGDGTQEVVTDQDHRPDSNFPHIITHEYTGISGNTSREIRIQIEDNWGYNRCCINDNICGFMDNDGEPCSGYCLDCDNK